MYKNWEKTDIQFIFIKHFTPSIKYQAIEVLCKDYVIWNVFFNQMHFST